MVLNQREISNSNNDDMAPLTEITVAWHWECYKSPPLQEISSRDLGGEVKSNFSRADTYRGDCLVNNSGNEVEISPELKLKRTSRANMKVQ